jgi:hypothetical protein
MKKQFNEASRWRTWTTAAVLGLVTMCAAAQSPESQAPPDKSQNSGQDRSHSSSKKTETHITPDQAQQLFALVDQLIQFSSEETGLPIKSSVKRELTTRSAVETYLNQKFEEDESAKRLQQNEIVLKKFGLLDRDFDLKPFLLALLKEQIEAYYDSKTKTVNLLDWVALDEQKPVLAHELTHALQDQRVNLEKWNDQTPNDVSTNYHDDIDHLAKDEYDTAREAVVEGQATAVMMDNILKPMGKSLIKDPEVVDLIKNSMAGSENSPVLARAPLLLSESLLFPYREGLSFEQDVWMDKGREAAFGGALDRPPTSTWEIINPREFEKSKVPVVPLMPDIHPILDKTYKAYDIGQIGELDLHILTQLFGGEKAARDLTPSWDGGIYWAGQRLSATTPDQKADTRSISIFYLSAWKNAATAQAFAELYANALGRKYSGLHRDEAHAAPTDAPAGTVEQIYTTNEGPVVITTRGRLVFVSESFDLDQARRLANLVLDTQGTGDLKMARLTHQAKPAAQVEAARVGGPTLSAGLVHLFAESGVMKAAVEAGLKAAQ